MRPILWVLVCALLAQPQDPAHDALSKAYEALRQLRYEDSIAAFEQALAIAPGRAAVHKDLAYAYLKIGENELARDHFRDAMRLAPGDYHAALEYAFLCHETRQQAEARRIFDRLRREGDPQSRQTAERAFQNIDRPLREGIERWRHADNFSGHYELATLAERRDELDLAAAHYERAWRLMPQRRYVLVDLGRVWRSLNRTHEAAAALLAASRGGEPRAAERAREMLPARYPYVAEFRAGLVLDPANTELRRELAYLLLKMGRQGEAETEFAAITERDPCDLLSAAQLGFLRLARGDRPGALPLLERVLRGGDQELANRVRAVLRLPQSAAGPVRAEDAREMADRSIRAGYMRDALKYLQRAHEADPADFNVMLKLGWTYNVLRNDSLAARWFALARKSPDVRIASQAQRAYGNLRPAIARVSVSGWAFPVYSSRWRDLFSYAQVKAEVRVPGPVRPYASLRFVGDARRTLGPGDPQYLSESAFIAALGLSTAAWHGLRGWAEAGSAIGYLTGRKLPDYRGGLAWFRGFGRPLGSEPGWFAETSLDGVFLSRFGDDILGYAQGRYGYTTSTGGFQLQLFCNTNLTLDSAREYWANFAEVGPGARFRWASMPPALHFNLGAFRGVYTRNEGNPRRPNYYDFRAGFGYAFRY
ncbi:MAG: hypothetical protein ACE15B_12660 [Bryobacteraceae bacterium]